MSGFIGHYDENGHKLTLFYVFIDIVCLTNRGQCQYTCIAHFSKLVLMQWADTDDTPSGSHWISIYGHVSANIIALSPQKSQMDPPCPPVKTGRRMRRTFDVHMQIAERTNRESETARRTHGLTGEGKSESSNDMSLPWTGIKLTNGQ